MLKKSQFILPLVVSFGLLSQAQALLQASRPLPFNAFYATEEPQQITLLQSGVGSFEQRLQLIAQAQEAIDTEFYIYESDQAGRLYTQALIEKAKQGVKVRILVDQSFMNHNISPFEVQAIRQAVPKNPIEIKFYNDTPLINYPSSGHRSHRKSLIVDGVKAIIGGRNLSEDYYEMSPEYNFIDRDVMIEGSLVKGISQSFEAFFKSKLSTKPAKPEMPSAEAYGLTPEEARDRFNSGNSQVFEKYKRDLKQYETQKQKADDFVHVSAQDQKALARIHLYGQRVLAEAPRGTCRESYFYADMPGSEKQSRVVSDQIKNLMKTAQRTLMIESPFFIQLKENNIFKKSVDRGVKVDILTNSLYSADVMLSIAPFIADAKNLVAQGANIYVHEGDAPRWVDQSDVRARGARWGTHAKSFVIDDRDFLVGSFNMDPRSANINAEMAFACRGQSDLAMAVSRDMEVRKSIMVKLNSNGDPVDGRDKFFNTSGKRRLLYYLLKPAAYLMESIL